MLGIPSFGLSLETKIAAVIAAVVLVSCVAWDYAHKSEQVGRLKANNAVQEKVIENLDKEIARDEKSDKVNEATNLAIVNDTKELVAKNDEIKKNTEVKLRQVDIQYGVKPESAAMVKARNDTISAIRIVSLWETFCTGIPDAKECQPAK